MRNTSWWIASLLALSALGCSSGTTPVATPTDTPALDPSPVAMASGELGSIYQHGDIVQAAVALYTVHVDPTTLSATSELKAVRAAQANDDLYLLPIDGFFRANSFRVTGVAATPTTIDLDYTIAHPFPAPNNPTGAPNGSTNRSDLGVAGMVLFLADVPTATGNTYFTDRVANTELVANADAYFSPGGMISLSGLTANTFPYRQLVDESGTGSRVGVSNGGTPTGNFGSDGWTRSEYGAGNTGWTGYGVLNQGQVSANTVSLDTNALSGGFNLDIAVLANYNDPRGGSNGAQRRANRLPPASPDASLFAYRMPHGALDVSRIEFLAESGGFMADNISASTLSFRVEDWDARATETAETDLSLDSSFTNVAQGESGLPALAVCIPGVLGDATVIDAWDPGTTVLDDDSTYGGDAAQDSGAPGDGLFYEKSVTKAAGSGQPFGDVTGMVRATDVEAASPLWLVLDGNLAPASNPPVPVTYQAFTVNQLPGNILPTGNWSMAPTTILNGGTTSVVVSSVVDPDSPTFNVQVDWGTGGGFVTVASGLVPGAGPFGPYVSPVYTLANPTVGETKTLAVRLVDGTSTATNLANNVGGAVLTVNPIPPCTNPITEGTQVFNANFESVTGDNAWATNVYGLPNTDTYGWSSFARCSTTVSGQSGFKWHTGPDGGFCGSYNNDYAPGLNNNVVSPTINLAGKTAARLRFNSFRNVDVSSATWAIYVSTDGGVSWGTPVYTASGSAAGVVETPVVNIDSKVGGNAILRFSITDPTNFGYANPICGWSIDNVEVWTCP